MFFPKMKKKLPERNGKINLGVRKMYILLSVAKSVKSRVSECKIFFCFSPFFGLKNRNTF